MAGEIVLIIDDSTELRSLLESILPFGGYEAVSTSSGMEGIELVAKVKPDVILVDLELPDTNGLAVLEELNRQESTIPAIMMTGYGSEGTAARALRLGVQGYLIKPFTTDEVMSAIEKALSIARLHREKEQLSLLVERYARHFKMMAVISHSMVTDLDSDRFLRRIVEAGLYVTQGEEGALLLWDEMRDQLEVVAAQSQASYNADCCSPLVGDERLGATLKQGTVVRIHAPPNATIELQTGQSVWAVLQAPLEMQGQILGMLSVVKRKEQAPFGKHEERMLTLLADYAVMALEIDAHMEGAAPAVREPGTA
jgi:two-component system NtrC family sensor kinase